MTPPPPPPPPEDRPDDGSPSPETDPRFPSGLWKGFYVQNGRKIRTAVDLVFHRTAADGGHVCGKGSDPVGNFRFVGTYGLDTGKVTLRKHYLAQHMVAYEGVCVSSLPMLEGRWQLRADHLTGCWRLWPVDKDNEWELESVEVQSNEGSVAFTDWHDFDQHVQELNDDE